jgi:hypothetical protein
MSLAFIFMAGKLSAENFIKNGDFSQSGSQGIPAHWTAFKSPLQAEGREDKNIFLNALASLRLDNPTEKKRTRFIQNFTVAPNKKYLFSFYIKGNGISGKNGVRALITRQSGKWLGGGSQNGLWKYKSGTFGWEKCEFKFTAPEDGKLQVSLTFLDAKGTVWFDGVSVTKIKETAEKNDSFPATGRLFPVVFQKTPYALCANIPGMLLLDIEGDSKTLLENGVKMELILPDELYFIGASPSWAYPLTGKKYYEYKPEKFSKTGKNRYLVDINPGMLKKVRKKGYAWRNYDRIFIGAKPGNIDKQVSVKWRLTAGNLKGPEKSFAVRIIPPVDLENIKCRRFGTIIMWPLSQTGPFPEVVEAYKKFWTGLTEPARACQYFMLRNVSPEARNEFLKTYKTSLFFTLGILTRTINANRDYKNKIPPMVLADGKEKKSDIAPYYLIEDPEGIIWDKIFPRAIKSLSGGYFKPEMILFDYEPRLMALGFSRGNRERFAKQAKLANVPSIEDIKTKYRRQWTDFRRQQNSLIVKKFCEAVHRHFPESKAVLTTDPLGAERLLSAWCCMDARLSDPYVDLFVNMPYYSGLKFYETVELNNKLLKKKNFPLIDPSERIKSFFSRYDGPKIKQNIIAAAATGCVGLGFWPTDCLDADCLTGIADGFFAVKAAEECYFSSRCDASLKTKVVNAFSKTIDDDGKKCVINYPNFKENLKVLLHRKNDEYVITALNYDPKNNAIVQAAIPEFAGNGFRIADAVSRKSFPGLTNADVRNGFLFSVPPEGAAVIKIGKVGFAAKGTVSQDELKKTSQETLARFKNDNSFKSLVKGSARISWAVVPGKDNTPALKLQSGPNKIYIDANSGADIVSWLNPVTSNPLVYQKQYGLLGDFVLYDTRQCNGPYKFKLSRTGIKNNIPEALFSYTVPAFETANPEPNPLQGLVVKKKISLSGSNSILIDFTLTNRNPEKAAMTFGFRVRNLPYLGASFSGLTAPVEMTTLSWGKKTVKPTGHMMYLKKDCKIDFLPQIKRQLWTPGTIKATAKDNVLCESFRFEAGKAAGFFVWRSPSLYTVELLSEPITLKYGESCKWPIKISAASD